MVRGLHPGGERDAEEGEKDERADGMDEIQRHRQRIASGFTHAFGVRAGMT